MAFLIFLQRPPAVSTDQVSNGLRDFKAGKRAKSRSAVHSSPALKAWLQCGRPARPSAALLAKWDKLQVGCSVVLCSTLHVGLSSHALT